MERVDILVAGGGFAGLSAAARLAADGHSVALVDPAPADVASDLRTTALLQPSVATLDRAGAWSSLAPHGAELRVMRLVDAGGPGREVRETADFTPPRTTPCFGWNVPNSAARLALLDRMRTLGVSHRAGTRVTGFTSRLAGALVRLSDGTQVAARLVVAADGRDSTLRRLAGIGAQRWDYGQQALVFAVRHPDPHHGISTEVHSTGGPCTVVPLPDRDGPASSVVWMVPGPRARDLAALDDAALGTALTAETLGLQGPLTVDGPRAVWPIISLAARRLIAPRLALIAEAAHVVPPIGAQGLNMSLADIETLATGLAGQPDPGAPGPLAAYEHRQLPRNLARIGGIDALNRAARADAQPLRDLRVAGLRAISRFGPLRTMAVRAGLGI